MKIRTKIILPVLITSVIVLSASFLYSYFFTIKILETEAIEHLETSAQLIKKNIESILSAQKDKIEVASTNSDLNIDELKNIQRISPEFKELFVIDSTGIIINSTDESSIGLDKSSDTYFINARNSTYIKPAYFSKTIQKDIITISSPHAGGVLVARIELSYFNDVVSDRTGLGETGESLLGYLDKNGKIVFFTDRRFANSESSINELEQTVLPIEEALKNIENVFFNFDYRHVSVIAVTRFIEEAEIGLVVKIDQAEAFALSKKLLISSIISILVVLLIFSIVVYILARVITKPITALHKGTEIIEKGNLEHKVGTESNDEVGKLSRAFDKMTTSIKNSRLDVDRRIEEQTQELLLKQTDLSNQQKAILNILEDVNEEKELTAKEKIKAESLLTSIGDGIIATDQDGRITIMNSAAEDLLGYTHEEMVNKSVVEILKIVDEKDKELPLFQRPMVVALSSGKKTTVPLGQTYYYVRKDGTKFPAGIMVSPFVWEDKIIGTIVVFRDVTIEKDVDKAKTEFVSLASHQLRTPLSTINWYSEMLLNEDAGKINKEQREYLKEVYEGNQRMVGLVNALLNVSRIELGTFSVDPKIMSIVEEAKIAVKELAPAIEKKKIKLITKFSKDVPSIKADPKLLHIVLQNLMSNAVKYTPDNGNVELDIHMNGGKTKKTKPKAKEIIIIVKDSGYGIPKKQQQQIFTKLFRADNVKEKDVEGTGLGLYLVKSIVEHSGGTVTFVSVENKGTTFTVTLPITGMKAKEGTRKLQ
jgi:PAS domain S-box-containing protein